MYTRNEGLMHCSYNRSLSVESDGLHIVLGGLGDSVASL